MKKQYCETFEEVRASAKLRTEVLRMREQKTGRRRRLSAGALVAAALTAVLAGSCLAVAVNPALREWFSREWNGATGGALSENQAMLIDSLTQKVGESAVSGDITVVVDSITVSDDILWALLDVEGMTFHDGKHYSFSGIDVEITPDPSEGAVGSMGYSVGSIGITKTGAARMLLQFSGTFSTRNQINSGGYALELHLEDLCQNLGGGGEKVLVQGEWDFSIPLLVDDLSPVITIDSAEVMNLSKTGDGEIIETETIALEDIRVSATGISFQSADSFNILSAAAILRDGTEVRESDSGGTRMEDGSWYTSIHWPVPIDVEDIVALRIGGTEIPLESSLQP